jgi:hypothetical protein
MVTRVTLLYCMATVVYNIVLPFNIVRKSLGYCIMYYFVLKSLKIVIYHRNI